MSEVKVNKVSPRTGTDVTVGGKLITESNGDLNLYPNGTGAVEIGGNTNPGTVILNCESNSHGIKLQSPPHSAGQSYTMKLPATNITAGKFLKVDSIAGSGATAVGQLSFADAGGGKINQIIQTVKSDTFTSTSTSYADVTGMSVAITPTATGSKVLVMATLNVGNNTDDRWSAYQLLRGSTAISIGDADGSKTRASVGSVRVTATGMQNFVDNKTIIFLDSPSTTSATTYKLQCKVQSGGAVLTFNRPGNAADADYVVHTASSITAIEVLA